MNKVINGKRYDTDAAELIGEKTNGNLPGEIEYYCETLYRKKRANEYFLHIEGGANSRAARRVGESWVSGELIEPLEHEAAKEWAEKNLTADEYESSFGEVDSGPAPLYLAGISAEARSKLDREASNTGKTKAQIVEELLEAL